MEFYPFLTGVLKMQIPMFNDQTFQYEILFGFSNFGHWSLFDIWNLIFVISISHLVFKRNTPSLRRTEIKFVCLRFKHILDRHALSL